MILDSPTKRVYKKNLEKVCCQCGEEFWTRYKNQIYCSRSCSYEGRRTYSEKPCKRCGRPFYEKTMQKHYCSRACYSADRADQLLHTSCDWCGEEISVKTDKQVHDHHFCGRSCYGKWKSADNRRKYGPLRDIRTTLEYRKWVRRIYERDGFVCVVCGGRDSQIDVHHIRRVIDAPELIMEDANAITLCRLCHLSVSKHEQDYEQMFCDILEVNSDIKPVYAPRKPQPRPDTLVCRDCGKELAINTYDRHPSCRWGRRSVCKPCLKKRRTS